MLSVKLKVQALGGEVEGLELGAVAAAAVHLEAAELPNA
jgi:hypothetical protein